jgi:uncharacterized protein YdbL (DUF1318 family)
MSNPSRFSRRLALVMLLAAASGGAFAQSRTLDAPRSAGTVGERYDGYAVVRDATQAATLAPLVEQVNAERRQLYAQRAASDHAPIDQIGRIYAAEILKSAPAGTWFLQESGQWVRK